MRDTSDIRELLRGEIGAAVGATALGRQEHHDLFDVELALHTLTTTAPGQTVHAVPALLDGHDTIQVIGSHAPVDAAGRLANARVAINRPISPYKWTKALAAYKSLPTRVRGFEIDGDDMAHPLPHCSVLPKRFAFYEGLLKSPLPFLENRGATVAEPGVYKIATGQARRSVEIPPGISTVTAPPHPVTVTHQSSAVRVTWEDLATTAADMDAMDTAARRGAKRWEGRIRDTFLLTRDEHDAFTPSAEFTIDGLLHMVGMVSAGKTTLIQVLSVWAARTGHRLTVVLGDNAAVFDMVDTLNYYVPDCAAPVVGQGSRVRQLEGLHKRQPPEPGSVHPAQLVGFEWTSTACMLEALRPEDEKIPVADAPCDSLVAYDKKLDGEGKRAWNAGSKRTCPFWHACRRHDASRALVDAPVWVATHWALTHTRVPAPLSAQRIRYLEAAWRRSDLFVIDEVDRVQTGLDSTFSSSKPLYGPSREAWIDEIAAKVDARLRETRHEPRGYRSVRDFVENLHLARGLGHLLYNLIRVDAEHGGYTLLKWMGPEYFTSWTLSSLLNRDISGFDAKSSAGNEVDDVPPAYELLREGFDAYIDRPHVPADEHTNRLARSLAELNHYVLVHGDEDERTEKFTDWVTTLPVTLGLDDEALVIKDKSVVATRLQLCVAIALFSHYLNEVLLGWQSAGPILGIDDVGFRQSPRDLRQIIPESPMGTILGFQYVPMSREDEHVAGELHFFEATGIGRAILLDLPRLFPVDGRGPNALLLSGTSWAGTSPRYHLEHRVDAILKPTDEILTGIMKSTFTLLLQKSTQDERPIRVSGLQGQARFDMLQRLVACLLKPDPSGRSEVDRIIDDLPAGRKKVLFLVGSYEEARVVHAAITHSPTRRRARFLVSDSGDDDGWLTARESALPRGEVASFGLSDDEILIAPLLAVERGHNILNRAGVAAIGAAFFLVRPHPSPRDVSWVTQSLNHAAMVRRAALVCDEPFGPTRLAAAGNNRRDKDRRKWRWLLHIELAYSRLRGDNERPLREQVLWTLIVTMWQVIGRLVRGGQDAHVYFCDAAFAPALTRGNVDSVDTSTLIGMREVLDKYCRDNSIHPDRHLVRALYGPLHRALHTIKEL